MIRTRLTHVATPSRALLDRQTWITAVERVEQSEAREDTVFPGLWIPQRPSPARRQGLLQQGGALDWPSCSHIMWHAGGKKASNGQLCPRVPTKAVLCRGECRRPGSKFHINKAAWRHDQSTEREYTSLVNDATNAVRQNLLSFKIFRVVSIHSLARQHAAIYTKKEPSLPRPSTVLSSPK